MEFAFASKTDRAMKKKKGEEIWAQESKVKIKKKADTLSPTATSRTKTVL